MIRTLSIVASTPMLALACHSPSQAQDLSGSVTLVSDYVFRGVTQTDERPALQVDLNTSWDNGFYAGAWASNVDFGSGDSSNLELDLYAGWAGSAGAIDLDLGVIAYTYPGGDSADQEFVELAASASHTISNLTFDVGAYYSPEFYGGIGPATYVTAGASLALTETLNVDVRASDQSFSNVNGVDYSDYQAGLTYTHNEISFGIRFHWGDDAIEESWAVSISKAF